MVFVLFYYNLDFGDAILRLVGRSDLGYIKIYMLIIGMNLITAVLYDSGVFQFLSLKTIKLTKGNRILMFIIFGTMTVFISSFISNLLTIFILAPITILLCGILKIDAEPYLILQVILLNVGGLITLISSNLNILVCSLFDIGFTEFFVLFAPLGFILFFITIFLTYLLLRKQLKPPDKTQIQYLQQFDDWSIVKNKKRFYRALIMFIITMVFFIVFSDYMGLVSILSGILMIIFVVENKEEGLKKINLNTVIYYAGIFITLEGLKLSGVFEFLGNSLGSVLPTDPYLIALVILWVSGSFSSVIANIPLALAFSPIIENLVPFIGEAYVPLLVTALITGSNLGDNLFPAGDVAIQLDVIEQQGGKRIKVKTFFKIGLILGIIQIIITSFYLYFLL
jgi:Na+/H+ antiporter NhaD/arsenite permease-like protein